MHSTSMAPALAWPDSVDQANARVMLDVGGGSGAHAIGATLGWPGLNSVIFDIPPVCDVAREFIERYRLQGRIRTHAGDFWKDPLPEADVHFYGMIYHDWAPEQCRFLTEKSFKALPTGGAHDCSRDAVQRRAHRTVSNRRVQYRYAGVGQQYSGRELGEMMSSAGFGDIHAKQTFGHWSIVTGVKP